MSDDSPKGKRPRGRRRARKARAETISYIVEIKDWNWEFSFGVNTMKDRGDPYLDFRHLEVQGKLLRPSKIKVDEVEVTFLPDPRLNETERKRDQPQAVGSFHIHHGALQFLMPMPADALPCVLQMIIAGRMRYVEMDGDRPRYRQGRIRSYRLVRDHDPNSLRPDE
jgi:hypothetical protein